MNELSIHPTADVSPLAQVGAGTRIWQGVQVREGVSIGRQCILGKNVYIDFEVSIGNRCKIQNNASVFHGATVEDGVFIGPHACITNDQLPRAIIPDGELKGGDDWEVGSTLLRYGCSVGAGAIILPDVTIGRFALVGAGSIVTRSVPDHGLVVGNPARLRGFVCVCGGALVFPDAPGGGSVSDVVEVGGHGHCVRCARITELVPAATPAP